MAFFVYYTRYGRDAALAALNGQSYDYAFRRMVYDLKNTLTLDSSQEVWLIDNKEEAEAINQHLISNQFSDQAIHEARLNILIGHSVSPWASTTGQIDNNPEFAYNASRMHTYLDGQQVTEFRLDNGDFIARGDYANCAYCSGSSLRTMYRPAGSMEWFDIIVPARISTDAQPFDFVIDKFWDGAKFVGRYLIPIEDVAILLGGRDFDNQEASQYFAGGMLVVGFIPGGKLLKPISKVVKGTLVWGKVIKVGDKTVNLAYKIIDDVVDFGSRSKLGQLLIKNAGEEAHHMIPWALRENDVVQEAAYAGFHMNDVINGKVLTKYSSLTPDGIHANHPAYNIYVENKLNEFIDKVPNLTPEQAVDFLEGSLIPDLDALIEVAKNSGLTLNEYFRTLL